MSDNTYPREHTIDNKTFVVRGCRKNTTEINGVRLDEFAGDGGVLIRFQGRRFSKSVMLYGLNYGLVERISQVVDGDTERAVRLRMEQIFGGRAIHNVAYDWGWCSQSTINSRYRDSSGVDLKAWAEKYVGGRRAKAAAYRDLDTSAMMFSGALPSEL